MNPLVDSKIVAFVFARGGSKGIPRKNLQLLAGIPLLGHSIRTAKQSRYISRVVVSTDDEEIAEVAQEFGAEVPFMRNAELAADNAPEWLSWQHAITTLRELDGFSALGVFVSLPTTSPLRSVEDVDRCIEVFLQGTSDIVVTATETNRHPAFNMVRQENNGLCELVMPSSSAVVNRQGVPYTVYDMTTVAYVADPQFILQANGIFGGRVRAVLVPPERAVDIDTEMDLRFADFLAGQQGGRI